MPKLMLKSIFIAAQMVLANASMAEPQRYEFINPTFGGYPFVSNHMLTLASKQYDPSTGKKAGKSELESFADQVRRRTLSSISSAIASNIRQLSVDDFTEERETITLDTMNITYYTGDNCNIIIELESLEDDEFITLDIPDFSCEQTTDGSD
jgi:curli production assembly/transport component CsgF